MNSPTALVTRDLVLIGGGHSHVTVLKKFGMEPLSDVRVTLISRDTQAPYSGMLPGLIAGHYGFDDAHIDLLSLSRFAGARFLHDEVTGVDLEGRRVLCRDRPPVAFDVLSINIGSRPGTEDVPGAAGVVIPVKPIDGFARRWDTVRERLLALESDARLGFVGGGAGGVELLLSIQQRLRDDLRAAGRSAEHLRYVLYTAPEELLHTHNAGVRRRFTRILGERGIEVRTGHRVTSVGRDGRVQLGFEDGTADQVDEVFWVTTAAAQTWPGASGLDVDQGGFVKVRPTLQTLTDDAVFAAGDIAAVEGQPRPKAGVFAVRQGPPLAANLRRALTGEALRPFHPQREFLSLISTGDRYAVASRSFWSTEGVWVWKWKDRIDRVFMRKFNDLPTMGEEADDEPREGAESVLAPEMYCAGCGSKIGSDVLRRALERIDVPERDDVLTGVPGADDAAVFRVPEGRVAVQTADQFRALIADPFLNARITTIHALGDLWAMGATPQTALALVTLAHAAEDKLEEDLVQVLAGIVSALEPAGAVLVGGHTNEGAEMAVGLSVSGHADPARLLRKSGLRPGDVLVLTKALGTGALFAAAMRGRARGRWIEAAQRSMSQESGTAARLLQEHGARAMTDVTGFGLVGHLYEMLAPSGCGARLDLDSVPALAGAEEALAAGIASSLQPQNLRLRRVTTGSIESPRGALLFDPQTAGGMLAAVPAEQAGAALDSLRAAGYEASARVGCVEAGDPIVRVD